MPKYEYQCPGDNSTIEIERSINDPEETYVCNTCGATMNRIWNSVPVTFNAPGFYSTDNPKR